MHELFARFLQERMVAGKKLGVSLRGGSPCRPRGRLTGCSSSLCVAAWSLLNCIMHRETSDKTASQLLGMASKGGGQSNTV